MIRIQINTNLKINVRITKKKIVLGINQEKNKKEINIQEYSNTVYSDKKMKAKYAPEYSVLNPETNSDSDSLKSKGARWVSAKVQTIHTGNKGRKIIEEKENDLRIEKEKISNSIRTNKVLKTDS